MKRIKLGDIFEIKTSKHFHYFQYVSANDEMGELIGIFDKKYQSLVNKVQEFDQASLNYPRT